MQRQEDEAGGPDVALLAVGAGQATVGRSRPRRRRRGGRRGDGQLPAPVRRGRPDAPRRGGRGGAGRAGLICERLPFRRPYHTPLFEPWMGPFRELFADVPFDAAAHAGLLAARTGAPFPADPDAIRKLAVNHWVTPVEFTRMIEAMYADGVRLFVEAGPRGNLSAFVEDILRGKPFAAIPANVPRKSGPTQINHLVAQLAAHHVPVNLGHLYAGRARRRGRVGAGGARRQGRPGGSADGRASAGHAAIMHAYLAVMEQFLDVQREVMDGVPRRPRRPPRCRRPVRVLDFAAGRRRTRPDTPFALVGDVDRSFEPGREVVFRRVMDEREDLYADDHTLGGRGVSRVDPAQNGLPVLPMTFSLEAMAEAASPARPGQGRRRHPQRPPLPLAPVRPRPDHARSPGGGRVGRSGDRRRRGEGRRPRPGQLVPPRRGEQAGVRGGRRPRRPLPRPARRRCRSRLTDEQPCQVHGRGPAAEHVPRAAVPDDPLASAGTGSEGIEGTLEVQPRDRWFRSNPDPRVAIDPVLVDAAMHILGAWHLEQPDWTGRILLPIGVQSARVLRPAPAGRQHAARPRAQRGGDRPAGPARAGGVRPRRPRLAAADRGRRTGGSTCRSGDVNFFGPKDQYFLSRDWPEAEPPAAARRACYFLDRRSTCSSRCCGRPGCG